MTRGLFALLDNALLSELGLGGRGFAAWNLVYRSEAGQTGLNRDDGGQEILSWLLRGSVVIGKDGNVVGSAAEPASTLWARIHAAGNLTIHLPDEAILAEAQRLVEYRQAAKLNDLSARYGKTKGLPDSPKLLSLFEPDDGRPDVWIWLLEHCARLCIWDRFTDFGAHPTMIFKGGDPFNEQTAQLCDRLLVPFQIVDSESALPAW